MRRIYMDHNATTPIRPEVLEAFLPYYQEKFANPSSVHAEGQETRVAMEAAREKVAALLGAKSREIVFTGCGTESDNMALRGVLAAEARTGPHIVTTATEHPAVIETCAYLETRGVEVTYVPVGRSGVIDPDDVAESIRDDTVLVSVMHGNNESGSVQPIAEIAKLVKEREKVFHTDAVQTAGKLPIDVEEMNIDLLALSGHKLNAPKGIGALYIREGLTMDALIHGGHQERNRRSGTENVAGIVALGRACELGMSHMEEESARLRRLRDRLQEGLQERIPEVEINGDPQRRLPGTLNMSFRAVGGEPLLINLDLAGVAVSTSSACASGNTDPSHVLQAMGVPKDLIEGSLRFSLGWGNTDEDVDRVVEVLPDIVARLRAVSGKWDAAKVKT
ncbi:MAG: cysteine desulfurase NifS [Nitrospinota bacterium]|nr:cysteine desulfurase NifS [Nitrospinota bacterium]